MTEGGEKDGWDIFGIFVPLIVGLAVAGVGGWFTYSSNQNQLQLNQIQALDKLRPLLTSPKPDERAFAYSAFSALGYEKLAITMIKANADESGRPVLIEAGKSGTPAIKAQAKSAIDSLNSATKPGSENAKSDPPPRIAGSNPVSLRVLHDKAAALQAIVEIETREAVATYTKLMQAENDKQEKASPGSTSHIGWGSFERYLSIGKEQRRQEVAQKHLPEIEALLAEIDASQIGHTDRYLAARLKIHDGCAPPYLGKQISCPEMLQDLVGVIPGGGN